MSATFDLTNKEFRTLSAIATGLSTREIAERFHYSIYTVKDHRERILRKMEANSMPHAVFKACRAGLL
jgi:DNA-binding CsgD family transcriptional regulator